MKFNVAIFASSLLMIQPFWGFTQGVGINETGASPSANAILDVSSSAKGMLIPRLSTTERNAISSPDEGLLIYNLDTHCFNVYNGTSWRQSCFECDFPLPSAGNSGPVCAGETLQLFASTVSGGTYYWSGPNGFTSSDQNPSITNAQQLASGAYTLHVEVNGCMSGSVMTIATVNDIPDSPVLSSNGPACTGTQILLTAEDVTGGSFSWDGPDGYTSNVQNPVISNAELSNGGTYEATVTVNGCTSSVSQTTVAVNESHGSLVYVYTGADQQHVVSLCASSVSVKMWGAGGGGANTTYTGFQGGGGGYATASLPVTPGETLTIIVGGGGKAGIKNQVVPGGYGGGGSGAGSNSDWGLGSGGGRSAVRRNTTELLTAGGGGGGGGDQYSATPNFVGGAGGGANGLNGSGSFSSTPGLGGTQSSGGANGGSALQGGNSTSWGAGGGGGYFGGGYGQIISNNVTGGGGGSGYDSSGSGTLTAGSGPTPGNSGDTDRAGAGQGGMVNGDGAHGRVLVSW